jgi:hypothetical protein
MPTLISTVILRSKTHAEWDAENPVILTGYGAYSTDTREVKIGDGTTHWRELTSSPYGSVVGPHAELHLPNGIDPVTDVQLEDGSSAKDLGQLKARLGEFVQNAQLNTFTKSGAFPISAVGMVDGPVTNAGGILIVFAVSESYVYQEYIELGVSKFRYWRVSQGSVWTSWKEVATTADLAAIRDELLQQFSDYVSTNTFVSAVDAINAELTSIRENVSDEISLDNSAIFASAKSVKLLNDQLTTALAGKANTAHTHTADQVGLPYIQYSTLDPTGGVNNTIHIKLIA